MNDSATVTPSAMASSSPLLKLSEVAAPVVNSAVSAQPSSVGRFENQLAMARLGMATSLFYALRTKHAPTASHSLRVAMSTSAWCERLGLVDEQRDRIEIASLLHDIGKIGIPDRILRKPAKLTVDEQLTIDCCAELGCEILKGCTTDTELLDIVRYSNQWFESRRGDEPIRGEALPLGSRMLAIAGAFDAMTSDQVFRAAMSRERALQELFRGSGSQFDPELTRDFVKMLEAQPELLHRGVVHRWLQQLTGSDPVLLGRATQPSPNVVGSPVVDGASLATASFHSPGVHGSFHFHLQTLSRTLRDGVAFINGEGDVLMWNDAMTRLTGITAQAIVGHQWDCETVGLFNRSEKEASSCPVSECLRRQDIVSRAMKLKQIEDWREVFVQTSPVREAAGGGVVLFIRDTSDRAELQHQIQSLHKKATSDGLTGVANRAEMDRCLLQATNQAKLHGKKFSLIICDIDHFKKVNDVHGHPAGDEALIEFAAVLQRHAREHDLVARYGGEEFVMLAIGSDNATATLRAEEIRQAISVTPLKGLGGSSVTASFGVTEFQPGDASDTVLARADRALLMAKENGRNRVVQLGTGIVHETIAAEPTTWYRWWSTGKQPAVFEFLSVTPVPIDLAIEKLRGFIADHRAEILGVTSEQVTLQLTASGSGGRRAADHQFTLSVVIQLSETQVAVGSMSGGRLTQTKIKTDIKPIRSRDRRNRDLEPTVKQVVASLRSYMMAEVLEQ